MQKKIVAVSLVILMVALLLASCGNKYLMGEINGVERPLVTDAEGNTELDDEGKIAVYVTDAKGNIKYDENGNPEKRYYDQPSQRVNGNVLETLAYKFTAPDGWTLNSNGVFYKDGTDDKCKIQFVKDTTLENGETYESFLNKDKIRQQEFIEGIKTQYSDSAMDVTRGELATGEQFTVFTFIIKDGSGSVFYYGSSVYIQIGNEIYSANYSCDDGSYDESFDFVGTVSSNLVIKK